MRIRNMCVCICSTTNFFFFKQKTAYEMRISDWSSDVCSSDLGTRPSDRPSWQSRELSRVMATRAQFGQPRLHMHVDVFEPGVDAQIGRASCRERVCQYV